MFPQMHSSDYDENLSSVLEKLKEKYKVDDQDLVTHLEGLLNTDYLKYWEYIHLDSLLSLQNPVTSFPDEFIFITYHQITELYFRMVLHELNQLRDSDVVDGQYFKTRLKRINWYFNQLIQSFDLIAVGLDQEQFLKFRSALHPASGFQSVQYRMVELASTDLINLLEKGRRDTYEDYSTIDQMFKDIYWKKGAIDLSTGKKSLTLRQFEEKYQQDLLKIAHDYQNKNLWAFYKRLPFEIQKDPEIITMMKRFDTSVNINWPLAHYKYAVKYLQLPKEPVNSTGGTNWQKYLPPRFQKRIFFPDIWTEEEIVNWGKSWVETEVLQNQ
jgi:tryptophan 2,3-dioxygenase